MPRHLILRTFDVTEPEMTGVGRRSRVLTETEFLGAGGARGHPRSLRRSHDCGRLVIRSIHARVDPADRQGSGRALPGR